MATGGVREWLRRCTAATSSGDVWVVLGIVFFVLGFTARAAAYFGIGAAFLAIGVAQKRRHRSAD